MAEGTLARAQKKAVDEGYTIVWGDESAFYLLPHAVRTWASRGKTPCFACQTQQGTSLRYQWRHARRTALLAGTGAGL